MIPLPTLKFVTTTEWIVLLLVPPDVMKVNILNLIVKQPDLVDVLEFIWEMVPWLIAAVL